MRILAITHGIRRGGAQEFLLEMLGLMKSKGIDVTVLSSESAEHSFLLDLKKLNPRTYVVPYKTVTRYPDMAVERAPQLVRASDVVWLADEIYLVAPKVKRIDSKIPIIAHLHCFALLCQIWNKTYGLRETCIRKCSVSRIIRCKQLSNESLGELEVISRSRMRAYQLIDFVKGPVDFIRWPMKGNLAESNGFNGLDGFAAPSKYVKDFVLTHSPHLETLPFGVIHNPITVPEIGANEIDQKDRPTMLYASGPSFTKGPHIALQATKMLLDEGKEASLSMINVQGSAWIENLIARLGLEKHVEVLPRLARSELCKRMANSDFVLMPSILPESFGRIPVEANLVGTPAIVSDRGALPDSIIDGATGILAEPSAQAFAKAISIAMSTDWNRRRIVEATKRFDPEVIADDFVRFLERFV